MTRQHIKDRILKSLQAVIRRILLSIIGLWLSLNCAQAHQMSTSYLALSVDEKGRIEGTWQVRLFDLNQVVPLDADNNGSLTWAELQANQIAVVDYLRGALLLSRQATSASSALCPLVFSAKQQIDSHFNEGYLVSQFSSQCAATGTFVIDYRAFFAFDSDHKVIVDLTGPSSNDTRIISSDSPVLSVNFAESQWGQTLREYLVQGVIHIWKGTDHILFLLSLLLTCVLVRQDGVWYAVEKPKQIFRDTAWIVTAFTLAHSLTLTATALNILTMSSHWVELGIALSVVLAALNNVWPVVLRLGWITFAFGLLHGMGFAGVLGELGLPEQQKLLAILAFNLGVELGQLAILLVVLPLLVVWRQHVWYRRWGMPLASLAICLVAIQWSIERL